MWSKITDLWNRWWNSTNDITEINKVFEPLDDKVERMIAENKRLLKENKNLRKQLKDLRRGPGRRN